MLGAATAVEVVLAAVAVVAATVAVAVVTVAAASVAGPPAAATSSETPSLPSVLRSRSLSYSPMHACNSTLSVEFAAIVHVLTLDVLAFEL